MLLNNQKIKYQALVHTLTNNEFNILNVKDIHSISLDPSYLNILIQNTPTKYMLFASNDRCSLYDLMQTELLNSSTGSLKNVVFNFKDKSGQRKSAILKKEIFLKKIARVQCPNIFKFKQHFRLESLRTTLSKMAFVTPHSKSECLKSLLDFKADLKSPYFCNIIEQIKSLKLKKNQLSNTSRESYEEKSKLKQEIFHANSYNKILSKKTKRILQGLCLNLNTPQKYCSEYFQKSFWSSTQLEKPESPILKTYCSSLNRTSCIKELNKNPSFCHFSAPDFPGIFPKPHCKNISRALQKSRLFSNYSDCPARTGNDAVTSFSRVLAHFKDYSSSNQKSCEINSTFPFAKFNEDLTQFHSWQINLCFHNKLNAGKKVCSPVVLGEVKNDKLSLTSVVQKIVTRLKGYSGSSCKIITSSAYNPAILKYKTGCYIIRDKKNCNAVDCDFKVILDGTRFKKYFVESQLEFDLFPTSFTDKNKSIVQIYSKGKKRTLRLIKSMSSFLQVYNTHKQSIFFGIGCAEEILPRFFKRSSLNQCTPLPLIADGFIEKNEKYSLVTRTSIDQVHAPRIIPWKRLYSGFVQYKNLHPIGAWGFYAIY